MVEAVDLAAFKARDRSPGGLGLMIPASEVRLKGASGLVVV